MLSAQQARSGVPAGRQSVLPAMRGVPWWGAVLIAGVPTVAGAMIDAATGDDLATAYRVLFFLGCVGAVLTVRRRALFTAVTQPPLIAFVVALITLGALNSDSGSGLRNFIINVMLPIAKTFPLMAWTFVVVALLGAARWYLTRDAVATTTPNRQKRTRSRERTARGRETRPSATVRRADANPRTRREAAAQPRRQSSSRSRDDAPAPRRAERTRAAQDGRGEHPRREFSPRADGYGRRPRGGPSPDAPPRDRARHDPPPPNGERLERYRPRERDSLPPIPRARYRGVNP